MMTTVSSKSWGDSCGFNLVSTRNTECWKLLNICALGDVQEQKISYGLGPVFGNTRDLTVVFRSLAQKRANPNDAMD